MIDHGAGYVKLTLRVAGPSSSSSSTAACPKKRILPPRKVGTLASVLAEEVAAGQEESITGDTYIMLTSDENISQTCDIVEEKGLDIREETTMTNKEEETIMTNKEEETIMTNKIVEGEEEEIQVPSFKIWEEDVGSGLRSKAQEEDISDAAYEKRHRKHELAEKKLKNRERERLAYERYQQQLAVERLRNTDSKSLISVAAFRNNDVTNDMSKLETVHKKLLKEAEDTLARYDSLGLGGNKRKADMSSNNTNNTEGESKNTEPEIKTTRTRGSRRISNTDSDDAPPKTKTPKVETSTRVTRSRKKKNDKQEAGSGITKTQKTTKITKTGKVQYPVKESRKSIVSTSKNISKNTKNKSSNESPAPPPIIRQRVTTFIAPNTAMPTGSRKSSRSALAFGSKISSKILIKQEFSLPETMFGEMMKEREKLRILEYQRQLDVVKENDTMAKETKI
ncbi:4113_t:CDS:2 [Diversispora eburnea]|uniref:4113_t:CDS:1 n=1 Tax=Diversispora eburnea TaxID=1213867 RepID=A0A9N8V5W0_9GLOM|nr:4113_t:CDS:2 [Diversispora eburnea]